MKIKRILVGGVGLMLTAFGSMAGEDAVKYDKPAKKSGEAIVVTDGGISARVYGSFPDEKIEIGRDGQDPYATMIIRHSLPVKSKVKNYRRGREDDGMVYTDIVLTDGVRDQRIFASRPDSVIVMTYGDELQLDATIALTSELPHEVKSFDDWILLTVDDDKHDARISTMLKVIPGPGNITTNPDGSLTLNYMRGASLILTGLTSGLHAAEESSGDSDVDKARMRLFLAGFMGIDKLREHRNDQTPGASDNALRSLYQKAAGLTADTDDGTVQEDRMLHARIGSAPDNVVTINLLPVAWPDLEEEGEVSGLEAIGGFEVGFSWDKGKVTGGYIEYRPKEWQSQEDEADVNVIINGEINALSMRPGERIRLESFMNLVRPYIE